MEILGVLNLVGLNSVLITWLIIANHIKQLVNTFSGYTLIFFQKDFNASIEIQQISVYQKWS